MLYPFWIKKNSAICGFFLSCTRRSLNIFLTFWMWQINIIFLKDTDICTTSSIWTKHKLDLYLYSLWISSYVYRPVEKWPLGFKGSPWSITKRYWYFLKGFNVVVHHTISHKNPALNKKDINVSISENFRIIYIGKWKYKEE